MVVGGITGGHPVGNSIDAVADTVIRTSTIQCVVCIVRTSGQFSINIVAERIGRTTAKLASTLCSTAMLFKVQ